MPTPTPDSRPFAAPGRGPWQLETAHYPRPLTRFIAEPTMRGIRRGWAEATPRYGLLFDTFEPALVNDFLYCQPVAVVGPRGMPTPPRPVFRLLAALHPTLRRRIRQSSRALEERVWRDDLRRWDDVVKPATVKAQLALQRVDPDALDDEALARHLGACRDNFGRMILQHHQFTLPAGIPLGDFLAQASAWTGASVGALLQLMSGSSPISLGVAAAELDALGAALRAEPGLARELGAAPPDADTLQRLGAAPGAVGEAARAYLELVGYRSLGYDVGDRYALELPEALVRAVRVAVEAPARAAVANAALAARTAAVRGAVPERHRAAFDDLLAEARGINRLRDERGVYSDCWAAGIARRALLAAGRRLCDRGALDDPELAVDASYEEVAALLRGAGGPPADELRARAEWRTTKTVDDAPKWLGDRPELPPADWMPPPARRAARAFAAWLFTLIDDRDDDGVARPAVVGLPASPGVYEGTARVVVGHHDFRSIQPGDVLVTLATSPSFNVVLPLLGGVVTDRGGQLSHAAIVAREYGIPCVVGTREATRLIKDGQRVRVDGTAGEVTVVA